MIPAYGSQLLYLVETSLQCVFGVSFVGIFTFEDDIVRRFLSLTTCVNAHIGHFSLFSAGLLIR